MTSHLVWMLDVGQGHSALGISAEAAMVVDCPAGKDSVVREHLVDAGAILREIFVTHRDLDHCGGVPALLEDPGAGRVHLNFGWALPPESTAKTRVKAVLSSIFSIVERDDLELVHEYGGSHGTVGSIEWTVLAPSPVAVGFSALNDNTNRSSMVVLMEANGTRVLITGDADDEAIERLLASNADLDVDVLLVPHHGAQLARLGDLVAATSPSVAVVSAGRTNGYGHPHSSTLEHLASVDGVRIMCTEVSPHCHADDLDQPRCAGSTCIQLGADPMIPDIDVHDDRVASLSSPVCITAYP